MKLEVGFNKAEKGAAVYTVQADMSQYRPMKRGWPTRQMGQKIESLKPRVRAVARKVLGEYLMRVDAGHGQLHIHVKVGTSTQKPHELRSFLGWVEHCAALA